MQIHEDKLVIAPAQRTEDLNDRDDQRETEGNKRNGSGHIAIKVSTSHSRSASSGKAMACLGINIHASSAFGYVCSSLALRRSRDPIISERMNSADSIGASNFCKVETVAVAVRPIDVPPSVGWSMNSWVSSSPILFTKKAKQT